MKLITILFLMLFQAIVWGTTCYVIGFGNTFPFLIFFLFGGFSFTTSISVCEFKE